MIKLIVIFLISTSISFASYNKQMDKLIDYAMSFVGKPYEWGSDGPDTFDCSGLVQEIVASAGADPKGDQTAQDLFNYYSTNGKTPVFGKQITGALLFFGQSHKKITHVAFALDQYRMIEAGNGGRDVKTLKDAKRKRAFVRVRLIKSRSDLFATIKPLYFKIGRID